MDTPRQGYEKFSGNTFRAYLSGLDAMNLRPVVRLMVPDHVKRMMDSPPPSTAWVEGDELPLLFNAVLKVQGLEGMRALGYEATRGTVGRFLKPLMQMTLAKHGNTPAALFANLSSLCRSIFQGLEFQYTPDGKSSGRLQIRSSYAMGPASWAAWEGSLRIFFEECGVTTGTISPSQIRDEGHVATMRVRW
ncbi:MAG TPA: hypothetical protein VF815_15900 [Myxococcaceae bacterium]